LHAPRGGAEERPPRLQRRHAPDPDGSERRPPFRGDPLEPADAPDPEPPSPRRGRAGLVARRPTRAVQLPEHRARRLRGEPGYRLQLLLRGREEAVGRAEVLENRTPPRRPDSLERVEDGGERPRVAPLAMVRDREAV